MIRSTTPRPPHPHRPSNKCRNEDVRKATKKYSSPHTLIQRQKGGPHAGNKKKKETHKQLVPSVDVAGMKSGQIHYQKVQPEGKVQNNVHTHSGIHAHSLALSRWPDYNKFSLEKDKTERGAIRPLNCRRCGHISEGLHTVARKPQRRVIEAKFLPDERNSSRNTTPATDNNWQEYPDGRKNKIELRGKATSTIGKRWTSTKTRT